MTRQKNLLAIRYFLIPCQPSSGNTVGYQEVSSALKYLYANSPMPVRPIFHRIGHRMTSRVGRRVAPLCRKWLLRVFFKLFYTPSNRFMRARMIRLFDRNTAITQLVQIGNFRIPHLEIFLPTCGKAWARVLGLP